MPVPQGITLDAQNNVPPGVLLDVPRGTVPQASSSAQVEAQPGNAFTSGTPLATFRANVEQAAQPLTDVERRQSTRTERVLHAVKQGAAESIGQAVAHPFDTLANAAGGILRSTPVGQAIDTARGLPTAPEEMAQGVVKDFQDNGALEAIPHLASQVVGQAALGEVAGAGVEAVKAPVSRFAGAVKQGANAFTAARNVPTTALTPAEQSAVAVTKAVNPATAAWNDYLQAAHDQTGNVVDFAKRNNLPISSARDLAKAAKAAQQETVAHYQQNFLSPNADITVPIEDTGYQGPQTGRGRATLADVDSRVNAINQELKSNFRKPTPGQVSSAMVSDAELIAEKQKLTPLLHQALADATGTVPEDIAALRVRGGQLGTIASETQGAANAFDSGVAKSEVGAPSIATTNHGIVSQAVNLIRGGPEWIAAGKLQDALKTSPIQPTPLVQPKITPAAPTITTPEAAQAEFIKSQQLDQAAQDAAQGRSEAVQTYRGEQAAGQQALAQQEFLRAQQAEQSAQDASAQRGQQAGAVRTDNRAATGNNLWASQGYAKVAEHLQNDPTSGLTKADVVKVGMTPKGLQLLIKASDLTPGSPAMRNLIAKIQEIGK